MVIFYLYVVLTKLKYHNGEVLASLKSTTERSMYYLKFVFVDYSLFLIANAVKVLCPILGIIYLYLL